VNVRLSKRRVVLIAGSLLILLALIRAFMPDAVEVETAVAARAPLRVMVEEEGETLLGDRYLITSPVAAYVRRIALEPGDPVQAGQPVVQLEPPRAAILDPRSRGEAAARAESAAAGLAQAEVALRNAEADRRRFAELVEAGAAAPQALEHATADAARARAARDAARAELTAARNALAEAGGGAQLQVRETLRAPASGRILTVHRESEGHVMPGEPLLEVGDTERLRISADVLSQDAVRIRTGTPVVIDRWGGDAPLEAVVSRVEPQGFSRVSALGVEERRVRVLADLVSPPAAHAGLGPGYRVLARFVVWQDEDVLQVPTAALFRNGEEWAVFVVEDGRAALREVQVGQEGGLRSELLGGVGEGERVIVHPGNTVRDGVRVSARDAG
jgi:HlyD family secretion protein